MRDAPSSTRPWLSPPWRRGLLAGVVAGFPILAAFPPGGHRVRALLAAGTLLALGLAAARLAGALLPDADGLTRSVAGFTFAVAVVTVPATWLGHFGLLSSRGLLFIVAGAFLLSRLVPARQEAAAAAPPGETSRWAKVELTLLVASAALLALAITRVIADRALLQPGASAYDDNCYHLPAVATWRAFGDLRMIKCPVGDGAMAFYPIVGELFSFFLLAPLDPSDFLARWSELPFALFALPAVAAVSLLLGLSGRSALLAALLYGSVPRVYRDLLLSAGNDCSTAYFALSSVVAALLLHERKTTGRAVFAGVSLGLLAGTKYPGLMFCLPLFILVVACAARARPVLVCVAVALATGGYTYLRNAVTAGNPIFPAEVTLFGRVLLEGWKTGGMAAWKLRPDYAIDSFAFLFGRVDFFGPLFRFTVLPAALAAPFAALLVRSPIAKRLRTALVLSLPAAFFLEFRWLMIDHRDIRYFLGGVALGAVSTAWLVGRAGNWAPALRSAIAAAFLVTLASSMKAGSQGRAADILGVALLATPFAMWPSAARWLGRSRVFQGIAAAAATAFVVGPMADTSGLYQAQKFQQLEGAAVLDEKTRPFGAAIAYVGSNEPYVYFGSRLQNRVFYVPSSPVPDAGFYGWGSSLAFPMTWGTHAVWLANLRRLGIRYVVVERTDHAVPELGWLTLDSRRFVSVYEKGPVEILEVRETGVEELGAFSIGPASSHAFVYLTRGWYQDSVSSGSGRPALIASPEGASITLPELDPPVSAVQLALVRSDPPRTIDVRVDGVPAGAFSTGSATAFIAIPESGEPKEPRPRIVELVPAGGPRDGPFPIGRTGVSVPVPLAVESAGLTVGNVARFRVGETVVTRSDRGYSLATLGPDGRSIAEVKTFDTSVGGAGGGPSRELAAYLRRLPAGTVVLGAISDDASLSLTEDAVSALRLLGSIVDVRGKLRFSHAFIGVAGAPAGTIPERSDARPSAVLSGDSLAVIERIDFVLSRSRRSDTRTDPSLPVSIDEPAPGTVVRPPLRMSGWCQELGGGPIEPVEFLLDGALLPAPAVTRYPRPDVAAVVMGIGDTGRAGWTAVLPKEAIAPGPHTLTVVFRTPDGRVRIYGPQPFESRAP